MVNVSIARRYARALLEVVGAHSDKVLEQLTGLGQLLSDNKDLADVLANPAFTRAQRTQVFEAVLAQLELDPTLQNFLRLLLERDRIAYLPDITRLFREQADLRAGRVRGKVTSAVALPPEALKHIESSLERITQRNVVLEAKVDPKILGGAMAQVGSVLYDGSLKSQLEDLRRTLQRR